MKALFTLGLIFGMVTGVAHASGTKNAECTKIQNSSRDKVDQQKTAEALRVFDGARSNSRSTPTRAVREGRRGG
ncbi:MAG: hypothetical protein AB7F86_16265 [Bdellovibrionales bacterium]